MRSLRSQKISSIKVRRLIAASYHLHFALKNRTKSSSIYTVGQTTTDTIDECYALFSYKTVCLQIVFERKVEKT